MRPSGFSVIAFLATQAMAAGTIDNTALRNDTDGHNWAAYGRTFGETHYSPLAEINRETVPRLNLAWTLDLDVTNNLSTPLAVEGVIYVASGYSIVHAVDAKTGELLWRGLSERDMHPTSSPEHRLKRINREVSKIFRKYPSGIVATSGSDIAITTDH